MLNCDRDILIKITGVDRICRNVCSCYVQNIIKKELFLRKHSSYERKLFYYKDARLSILFIIHV